MTTVVSVPGISTTITEVETGQTVVSTVAGPSTVVSTAAQPGQRGRGVPAGGTTGQVLGKLSNADLDTAWVDETGGGSGAVASVNAQTGVVVLDAADVGADVAGAAAAVLVTAESYTDVETARAEAAEGVLSTALSGKAASSALTAEVTRATTAEGVNATAIGAETTRAEGAEVTLTSAVTAEATARSNADAAEVIARNAAIATAVAGVLGGAPGALDTLKELADAINDDASFAATVTTALAGKQPLDSDLTAIAALSTTAFGRAFLTMADAAATKTVLALVKGDVGLGSVDNTSDAGKPVSTAQQAALDGKQPLDSDLTTIAALDASTAGAMATDGSGWVRKTYAQLKTALGLVKADVGLGNVDNTSDANKPVSTAQAAADALALAKASNLSDVANAATARTNLGVPAGSGTSTGTNTGDQTLPTALPPNGAAGGDLAGTYPNPTLAVDRITKALLTTKGDVIAASAASTPARVGVGSDGQVLTADAASSAGVKWAAAAGGAPSGAAGGALAGTYPNPTLAASYTPASGLWWHVGVGPLTTFATTLNVMYLFPADMPAAQTWQGRTADIAVAGTTGAVLRAGFYGTDTHGQPDLTNLISDIGTQASTTATLITWSGLSVALPKGRIWLALVSQTAVCTLRSLTTGVPLPFSLPSGTSPVSNNASQLLSVTGVSGALPTSGTLVTNNNTQPKTWLQAA